MRGLESLHAGGKRVLVRVDFNVPLDGDEITDDTRVRAALPTIRHLTESGARVILVSHLGRPNGRSEALSLAPVAERLATLLERPVAFVDDLVGAEARRAAGQLSDGDVLLLQNVRFEPGETRNDDRLSADLADLADIFVNDAFGAAHRAHASTTGIAGHLPSYAGFLIERELTALGALLDDPERPFVLILGGAKIADKLPVARNLLDRVDTILVGGGLANTFLKAQGHEVGRSLCEDAQLGAAREFLAEAAGRAVTVHLPVDVVVAESTTSTRYAVYPADGAPGDQAILDLGPRTRALYEAVLGGAKTVFWNGPMGLFEQPAFAAGTIAVAQAVANVNGRTIAGGGDSVAAIEQHALGDRFSHISTGGGASLEFLSGVELPGIAALGGA